MHPGFRWIAILLCVQVLLWSACDDDTSSPGSDPDVASDAAVDTDDEPDAAGVDVDPDGVADVGDGGGVDVVDIVEDTDVVEEPPVSCEAPLVLTEPSAFETATIRPRVFSAPGVEPFLMWNITNQRVYHGSFYDGAAWGDDTLVSDDATVDIMSVALAEDRAAAWGIVAGGGAGVLVYFDGDEWLDAVPHPADRFLRDFAMTSDGGVLNVFGSPGSGLELMTYDPVDGFGEGVPLAAGLDPTVHAARMVLTPSGDGGIIGQTSDGPLHGYTVRGGEWVGTDATVEAAEGFEMGTDYSAAVLPNGDVLVVWNEDAEAAPPNVQVVNAATLSYDDGGDETVFSEVEAVFEDGVATPGVATNASGDGVLVVSGLGYALSGVRWTDGTWGEPVEFGVADDGYQGPPVINAAGDAYVAWSGLADFVVNIQRSDAGSDTWTEVTEVEPPSDGGWSGASQASFGLTADGDAVVAWFAQNADGDYAIIVNVCQ